MRKIAYNLKEHGAVIRRRRASGIDCGDRLTTLAYMEAGIYMKYRTLGKTGLSVSEIGLGAEWLERHNAQEVKEIIDRCEEAGINILDCWMSEPNVRSNIGKAIAGKRDRWIIQGHIGSTWQDGQ